MELTGRQARELLLRATEKAGTKSRSTRRFVSGLESYFQLNKKLTYKQADSLLAIVGDKLLNKEIMGETKKQRRRKANRAWVKEEMRKLKQQPHYKKLVKRPV